MKFKFKFSSDVNFRVIDDGYDVDEVEIMSRVDTCIDDFVFLFTDKSLKSVVLDYLTSTLKVKREDVECRVVKNESEFSKGRIKFDCEVEFNGKFNDNKAVFFDCESDFYYIFVNILTDEWCYLDMFAIYKDYAESEEFVFIATYDTKSLSYSCTITEE